MRNIVILNSLHFSYPLPILMRVSYNTLIVKQNTSDYYKYTNFSRSDTAVHNKNRKHPTDLHGTCNFTNRHEKTSFKQTDKTTFSRYKRNAGFLPDAAEPGK